MSLYPELDKLSLEQLMNCFHNPPPEGQDYASSYYPEVTLLIRQQGEEGETFLLQEMEKVDSEHLRAIIFALTEPKLESPILQARLLSYLGDERPLIVAEAIDGLRQQGETGAKDAVLALSGHPSAYVRNNVILYIGSMIAAEEALTLLKPFLTDTDAGVRETAVEEISHLGQPDAIEYLIPLLRDIDRYVRDAAEEAIEALESET